MLELLRTAERRTRPMDPDFAAGMTRRWTDLPEVVKSPGQVLGRFAPGCEGTHGVFPACDLASMTHGDFDYDYLEQLVLGSDGSRRLDRVSLAGHVDKIMFGRRGIALPPDEVSPRAWGPVPPGPQHDRDPGE